MVLGKAIIGPSGVDGALYIPVATWMFCQVWVSFRPAASGHKLEVSHLRVNAPYSGSGLVHPSQPLESEYEAILLHS